MPEWHIKRFGAVSSTQDIAREAADKGAPAGTVIIAVSQEHGRGRGGNVWKSPPGNLFSSILLRPGIEITQLGQYSFLVALALNRTLCGMIGESHTVLNKWPNDILVDGKKIAGILLEGVIDNNQLKALIIGTGINITTAPEDRAFLNQVSMRPETVESVLADYLTVLCDVIKEYESEGFDGLREEWLDRAFNLHGPIKVRLPRAILEGVFDGLENDGALRLKLANGEIKVIHSGEVFFG